VGQFESAGHFYRKRMTKDVIMRENWVSRVMAGSLVILTGASGGGKTGIALAIQATHPEFAVFHFDTIGVPSVEVMATFGSRHQPRGAWQRAMTLQWFERITPILKAGDSVLFEGQMRIAFIQEALATYDILNARVILVECE
jgi:hypothetical protein